MTFGKTWLRYETVGSTMDVAREVFARTQEFGVVVQAQSQTAGRGRQGHAWFTPPSGTQLCLTVVGYPVALGEAWRLAPLAGLAVAEGITTALPDVHPRLRFPNDVLLEGKKLAGVLVETIPMQGDPTHCVPMIGIGINVNVHPSVFPEVIRPFATSLLIKGGRVVEAPVARVVLDVLGQLWEEPLDSVFARWHAALDPDARRTFLLEGEGQVCRVVLLSPEGRLTLETANGDLHTITAAQVVFGED